MLNKILKIDGVASVNKTTQKGVNGGKFIPTPPLCSVTCATVDSGPCGPPHCPGVCTGNGGYVLY